MQGKSACFPLNSKPNGENNTTTTNKTIELVGLQSGKWKNGKPLKLEFTVEKSLGVKLSYLVRLVSSAVEQGKRV